MKQTSTHNFYVLIQEEKAKTGDDNSQKDNKKWMNYRH